jgi:tetratricopeptide (TPR) repeat protein
MKPMKRLLLPLFVAACVCLASCKSGSGNESAANPSGPSATPTPATTPPPGAEELSEDRFQKDVRQHPEDTTAHYNLGGFYLAEHKYAEAAEQFNFVVSKNPKDVDALGQLGTAYAALNKFDEAIDAFRRAAALAPKDAELHRRLADAYEKSGRQTEAAQERAELARLRPNEHAKELYKQGKYVETIAELQKQADKNEETYLVLGNALLRLNQAKDAVSDFQQAIRMNPKYADAYFRLGNA